MKIRTKDERFKEPERTKPEGSGRQNTTVDEPLPLKPPLPGDRRYGKGRVLKETDKRLKKNYTNTKKNKSMGDAAPHTFWIRKDIYAAFELLVSKQKTSKRHIIEAALYDYLISAGRVTELEMKGHPNDYVN